MSKLIVVIPLVFVLISCNSSERTTSSRYSNRENKNHILLIKDGQYDYFVDDKKIGGGKLESIEDMTFFYNWPAVGSCAGNGVDVIVANFTEDIIFFDPDNSNCDFVRIKE